MGLLRQEYCSGLSFPSPGNLLNPGIEVTAPALAGRFSTAESQGKHMHAFIHSKKKKFLKDLCEQDIVMMNALNMRSVIPNMK